MDSELNKNHSQDTYPDQPVCNMCGKPLDELDQQEDFGFDYYIGYGSMHDLEHVHAKFCCNCFDKLLDTLVLHCKINPVVGEYELGGDNT